MSFKKNWVFLLIFMGILVLLCTGTISASSFDSNDNEVIIDGVPFVLNYTTDYSIYDADVASFNVGYDIYGFIYEIDNDKTLKFYTNNDSSRRYITAKENSFIFDGDIYTFVNGDEKNGGYFFIFQKDNKKFVYKICSDINSSDETKEVMLDSLYLFSWNNNLTILESSPMSIKKVTIATGSSIDDKSKCTVYAGKEYAGQSVKISVLYSDGNKNLNKGLKVDKKVSDSGTIVVYSKDPFDVYPDKAKITIYDSHENKIDTKTVKLSQNSKPQSFTF